MFVFVDVYKRQEFKQQMRNWIHDLVSTISTRGWNNVPDMTLSILYGKSGLKDMNQLITYQYEADRMNRQWYSCLLYTSITQVISGKF